MYSIIDIETTGGNKNTGRITEIAAFNHDGHKVVDSFSTLVNPEMPIPPFIVNLTGITDEMVADAPKFEDIADELERFTSDSTFVAHNVNFDFGFIREEFRRIGRDFKRKRLCTVQLSRETFPDLASYSLGKITDQLGIELNGHHRAEADAKATIKLFEKIIAKKQHTGLFEVNFGLNDLSHIKSPYISLDVFKSIPDDCGIFKIYNSADELIFVKRSSQILTALSKKLQLNGTKNSRDLIKETYRLDWEITGSNLLSQLLEAEQTLAHNPRFNFGKFSMKARYGLYFQENKGSSFLTIKKRRRNDDPLVVFSSYYEGLDYLKKLSGHHDLTFEERKIGKYNQPMVSIGNDYEPLLFPNSKYAIVDEAPEIHQKTLILVEDEARVSLGYVDNSSSLENISSDDLQLTLPFRPEHMMIIRHYLRKSRYEKIIQLRS